MFLEQTIVALNSKASSLRIRINRVRSGLDMDPLNPIPQWNVDDDKIDNDVLEHVKELTRLGQEVSQLRSDLEFAEYQMEGIELLHGDFRKTLSPSLSEEMMKLWHELKTKLDFAGRELVRERGRTDVFNAEVQGLVQTVYTLVAVRDNSLNHEVARASLRMAEDSRKVAILTRQDSTDMRVIAGATLVFLPATFVATLFSTDFFNFTPSKAASPSLVSKWIWLYLVVTVALTGIVMLIWRQVSRTRDRETAKLLHLKGPELLQAGEEEGGDVEAGSAASGISLQEIRNRVTLRQRTQTE
ncbi:hypothetical protein LTR85_008164 [Meristemomyces frigidus]|nr:hypothetical protein LTR85_008164 [Meristemomyces frigidus]